MICVCVCVQGLYCFGGALAAEGLGVGLANANYTGKPIVWFAQLDHSSFASGRVLELTA